jgi:hypothetical protein
MPITGSEQRALVLSDGGLESLLGCAWVREQLTVAGVAIGGDKPPILLPWTDQLNEAKVEAIISHASMFGLKLVESLAELPLAFAPAGDEETTHRLLAAADLAARSGCGDVIWPISAGGNAGGVDVELAAKIEDVAWLVSRLGSIHAMSRGAPSVRIQTPFLMMTCQQVAELVLDMDLDPSTCWWWHRGPKKAAADQTGNQEREKWLPCLERVGAVAG